ncbi:efflux RND transporter periplasmic adaptor subunit, partial [Patescibacteria group bacterium]|nr:efflux RND transporter periplasmic adaptor subunit [Patescibacteria group bacterium]
KKKKFFLKKPHFFIPLIIIVALIGWAVYSKVTQKPTFNYVKAERGTIVQEVSITGRVKPAESVDLAFEQGGKINRVNVGIGDKVYKGQVLAGLDNSILLAQLSQAEADLSVAEAKLDELKKGTRPEEIQLAETELNSAKTQADVDLQNDYDGALTAIQEAVVKGKNAILDLTDLQFKYFTGNEQDDLEISDAKRDAVLSLLGQDNAGRLATESISKLTGGAYASVQTAIQNQTHDNIDKALSDTLDSLQKVNFALNTVPIKSEFTATEKSDLSTNKTTIGASVTTVSSKEQAIASQKVTNTNNIQSAEDSLALKKAGSTSEQIVAEEARVRSSEASVQNIRAQINRTVIYSPIAGVVTKQDAKVGEIVSANTVAISLFSASNFEIEAYIPEVDVSKVAKGDSAAITLDAYGSDVDFMATVTSIEPAETIIEGVATYKTALQFNDNDSRIKSGMTANIDIQTEQKDNALKIPARAVYTKNGKRYVEILDGDVKKEIEVKTGIRGSEGDIEITEGLSEGQKIII